MSKKKTNPTSFYEVYRAVRRDFGNVSPLTKIIPNKKKNPKTKHKGKEFDYE